jgi:predicted lipid-binding transport protein (Tim44 family)
VRVAWVVGGLLLVSVVGLGVVIMHHRTLETQAQLAKAEAVAKIKAEAEAKVAAAAAAARAAKEVELAAKRAAQPVPATTVPAAATASGDVGGAPAAPRTVHAHRAHGSHAKGGKTSSKASVKSDSGRGSSSGKPDAIDELLRKMK